MRQVAVAGTAAAMLIMGCVAQAGAQTNGIDRVSAEQLQTKAKALLAEAGKSPEGMAVAILQKASGHFGELVARVKTGGAEMHNDWDDVFIILDGEATEIIGGTIVDPKDTGAGETRGTKVDGGTPTPMHKGDIIQIAARTPHQLIVPPGKSFAYYVVKVQQPK